MNKIKLSIGGKETNFEMWEFQCKDGNNLVKLNENLLDKLQQLRDLVKVPVTITSGYRTPDYNEKCGGSKNSEHMKGNAADIKVKGMTPILIARLAKSIGFTGIGVYTHNGMSFTHVDVRPKAVYWFDQAGTHDLKIVKSL